MSFVSKEKTADATWKVSARIEAEDFCAQLDATFKKELQNITLPGFRRGKAPRAMVERRLGAGAFFEEALDALLPGEIAKVMEEAEIKPLYRPEDYDFSESDGWKEQGIDFSFTVAAQPEVTIENYMGLEVEVPSAEVTQADIDARIHELRHRNARQVEVEGRPAQSGDGALIDFLGKLDGEPFEGGAAEGYELHLGSGQFIPGFEEQIVGHSPGESFEVNVTFPEEYHAENLAGKPVVFEVTLQELKTEELPEVDDDFAQEVGEDYDTVEDLRLGLAAEEADGKAKAAAEALERGVHTKLAELLEGEIPGEMFERRTQRNVELFPERIGIPLERYLEIIQEDEESFMARMREQSAAQVKMELALEKVAELEGVEISAEEIDAEYQRVAEEYKVPLAKAKYGIPEEEIVKDLKRAKALELVKEAAVQVEAAEAVAEEAEAE